MMSTAAHPPRTTSLVCTSSSLMIFREGGMFTRDHHHSALRLAPICNPLFPQSNGESAQCCRGDIISQSNARTRVVSLCRLQTPAQSNQRERASKKKKKIQVWILKLKTNKSKHHFTVIAWEQERSRGIFIFVK